MQIGPHRDLVQEMADGIRSKGLHFGLYFSEMDWFHPLYVNDKKTGRKDFPQVGKILQSFIRIIGHQIV
jgi:alpha-L-fucosidase